MPIGLLARVALASAALLLPTGAVLASTSPDGKIAFDLPADGSLVALSPVPAPAIGMWATHDRTCTLVAVCQPNPRNFPLELAGLIEGTVGPLNGTLLSSGRRDLGSVPAYDLEARGTANGKPATICERVAAFDGQIYQLIGNTAGPQTTSDPRLVAALDSFRILTPTPTPPPPQPSPTATPATDAHTRDVRVAEFAVGTLIAAGLLAVLRKLWRDAAPATPPPPRG